MPAGLRALLAQFDVCEICFDSNTSITQRDVSSRLHGLRGIVIDDLVRVQHQRRSLLSSGTLPEGYEDNGREGGAEFGQRDSCFVIRGCSDKLQAGPV